MSWMDLVEGSDERAWKVMGSEKMSSVSDQW